MAAISSEIASISRRRSPSNVIMRVSPRAGGGARRRVPPPGATSPATSSSTTTRPSSCRNPMTGARPGRPAAGGAGSNSPRSRSDAHRPFHAAPAALAPAGHQPQVRSAPVRGHAGSGGFPLPGPAGGARGGGPSSLAVGANSATSAAARPSGTPAAEQRSTGDGRAVAHEVRLPPGVASAISAGTSIMHTSFPSHSNSPPR